MSPRPAVESLFAQRGDMSEHAAQALDTDPTIYDHLAQVYLAQGDAERAQEAWRKALELDDTLEDVKRKLEALMSRNATMVER